MKVPPKRKGNLDGDISYRLPVDPSMKVPPKRKGNGIMLLVVIVQWCTLNESPSEKEGKSKTVAAK